MATKVPQNEENSGGGKDGGKEGVGPAICWGGADRGAYTLRNDTKEELPRDMPIPTQSEQGPSKEREEAESPEKDRSRLTKMTTPPLACMVHQRKAWSRPGAGPPERRAENPGIQKEEDELRLDSWTQIRSTGRDKRK